MKRLEDFLSLSIVEPVLTERGWQFGTYPDSTLDALFGVQFLHQIYTRANPKYSGRATVPVLWDKQQDVMVNNESADILRMLNSGFEQIAPDSIDLYPSDLTEEIDRLNAGLYNTLNNGVYQAGFASSQSAYEEATAAVFATLDSLETRFNDGRDFMLGERLTETDIRLFVPRQFISWWRKHEFELSC